MNCGRSSKGSWDMVKNGIMRQSGNAKSCKQKKLIPILYRAQGDRTLNKSLYQT